MNGDIGAAGARRRTDDLTSGAGITWIPPWHTHDGHTFPQGWEVIIDVVMTRMNYLKRLVHIFHEYHYV